MKPHPPVRPHTRETRPDGTIFVRARGNVRFAAPDDATAQHLLALLDPETPHAWMERRLYEVLGATVYDDLKAERTRRIAQERTARRQIEAPTRLAVIDDLLARWSPAHPGRVQLERERAALYRLVDATPTPPA